MNIPEGFALVPVEPTEEMLLAGYKTVHPDQLLVCAYKAMITSSPEAPQPPAYNEAKDRELFEAFAMEHFLPITRGHSRDYLYNDTEYAWAAWKACAQSRDGSVGDE